MLGGDPVTIRIRRYVTPGRTLVVDLFSLSEKHLNTPATTTWTCTQAVNDRLVELNKGQCDVGTSVTTTITPEFRTPRGCKIVVTVAANSKGFGSTNCLTSDEIVTYEATMGALGKPVDVSALPPCPETTNTGELNEQVEEDESGRKRCVARN